MTRPSSLRATIRALRRDTAGLALIEFAYGLPILLALGLGGIEIANLSVTRMRISQIGMAVADNAARVGTSNGLALKKVYESDIYDIFEGARVQGLPIDFKRRGRVILSSLQQNASGAQWIAWQRCYGDKSHSSTFGTAGNGRTNNTFAGMGPTGNKIVAPPSTGVMFVEIAYDYNPLVEPFARGLQYFGLNVSGQVLTYRAAYIVRDPRELGVSTETTTTTEDYGLFQDAAPLARLTC